MRRCSKGDMRLRYDKMSDISEDNWCAGRMSGNEYPDGGAGADLRLIFQYAH
jgi:hypothetical protein